MQEENEVLENQIKILKKDIETKELKTKYLINVNKPRQIKTPIITPRAVIHGTIEPDLSTILTR
jgi:hypothetical protein